MELYLPFTSFPLELTISFSCCISFGRLIQPGSQLISYLTFCNKNSSSSSLFPTFWTLVYKQRRPLILCLTVFLDLKEISLAYRRKAVRAEKSSKIRGTNINLKTTPFPTSCWYLDMWQMDNYRKSFQKGGGWFRFLKCWPKSIH